MTRGQQLSCDFEVADYRGRRIHLDHSNWEKHPPRHPEVVPYHDALPLVLAEPTVVTESAVEGTRQYYKLGVGQERYRALYLLTIVGIDDGHIRTAYFCPDIDPSGTVVFLNHPRL